MSVSGAMADVIETEENGNLTALQKAQQMQAKPLLCDKLCNDDLHRLTILEWFAGLPVDDITHAYAVSVWDLVASRRGWNSAGMGGIRPPKIRGHLAWPAHDEALAIVELAITMKPKTQEAGEPELGLERDPGPAERDTILIFSGVPDCDKKDQWKRIVEVRTKILRQLEFSVKVMTHLEIAYEIMESSKDYAQGVLTSIVLPQWADLTNVIVKSGEPTTQWRFLVGYLMDLALTHVPREVYAAPGVALGVIACIAALAKFPWDPTVPLMVSRLSHIQNSFACCELDKAHCRQLEDALLQLWQRVVPPCFVVKKWHERAEANNLVELLVPPKAPHLREHIWQTPERRLREKTAPPAELPQFLPIPEREMESIKRKTTIIDQQLGHGGRRAGAGRPKGSERKTTKEPPVRKRLLGKARSQIPGGAKAVRKGRGGARAGAGRPAKDSEKVSAREPLGSFFV